MGKTIKMVAMYGGREVVVGRCHPGQARKLRKLGLAEWDKDRLVMTQLAPEPQKEESGWRAVNDRHLLGEVPKQKPIVRTDWEKGILEDDFDEIDPEKLISMYNGQGKYARGEATVPAEIQCEALCQWVGELKARREKGQTLYSCDDPLRRLIGFVDDEANEVILMGLRVLKQATPEEWEELAVSKESFASQAGREELIGVNEDGFSFASFPLRVEDGEERGESGEILPIPELEALWIQDAEEIGEQMREAASEILADLWARPAPAQG